MTRYVFPAMQNVERMSLQELKDLLCSDEMAQAFSGHFHKGFVHESFGGPEKAIEAFKKFARDFITMIAICPEAEQKYYLASILDDLRPLAFIVRQPIHGTVAELKVKYDEIEAVQRAAGPQDPSGP